MNTNAEKTKERLKTYYNNLINSNNKETTKTAISYVVEGMTDDIVIELEKTIEFQDNQYEQVALASRIYPYVERYFNVSPIQKKIINPVEEFAQSYEDYDFSLIVKEEINGNYFSYRKDMFPIEDYRDRLFEIGREQKNNHWAVSLTNEGELVLY